MSKWQNSVSFVATLVQRRVVAVALCGTLSAGIYAPHGVDVTPKQAGAEPSKDSRSQQQLTQDKLFHKLHERHDWQESHLSQFSVIRTYSVQNEQGITVAQEVVMMEYRPPGIKTFTITSSKGSGFIRSHVFRRLMTREASRTGSREDSDGFITPENYRFGLAGQAQIGGSECTVVHAIPKYRKTYLFEGYIWIDNQDFAIVKIKGHLAKSPSFWVKRVEFVRQYQKINGFFLLSREEAIADIKIYGRKILTIDYKDYNFSDATEVEPLEGPRSSEGR